MSSGYYFIKHIKSQCYEHSLNMFIIPSVYEEEKGTGKIPKKGLDKMVIGNILFLLLFFF